MVNRDKLAAKLREESLGGGGKVSLAMLIQSLIPVGNLRDLAREHGLSPKGGYRLERAPAKVLASALCDALAPEALEDVCELLAEHMTSSLAANKAAKKKAAAEKSRAPAHLEPVLKLKAQELEQEIGRAHV